MPADSITIRVPASTSNLGSGFDTLGLALQLHTTVTVTRIAGDGVVTVTRRGDPARVWDHPMAAESADLFFRSTRCRRFGIRVEVRSRVPVARGLGYSATVRVGVLAALDSLAGTALGRDRVLALAATLEGHPDNASPAVHGGFTVSGPAGNGLICRRFAVRPGLRCVVLVPDKPVNTDQARALLPESYPRADAAHALNRAALITAAFAAGDYEGLRGLFDDRVHQPARRRLVPRLDRVIAAGVKAGALGGFLSGSGSGILCLTLRKPEAVARAMERAWPGAAASVLRVANEGYRVS